MRRLAATLLNHTRSWSTLNWGAGATRVRYRATKDVRNVRVNDDNYSDNYDDDLNGDESHENKITGLIKTGFRGAQKAFHIVKKVVSVFLYVITLVLNLLHSVFDLASPFGSCAYCVNILLKIVKFAAYLTTAKVVHDQLPEPVCEYIIPKNVIGIGYLQ